MHGGFRDHRISRWSMSAHLCGLWDLIWYRLIRSRGVGWSRRSRHASLCPFAFHFHSLGFGAFTTHVVWSRSLSSGCIGCVCIDWSSSSWDPAVHSRCLRRWWRLRAGRSIAARRLRICRVCCRCRRGRRRRGRGRILILAHDSFKIRKHSPLLFVREVQLGRAIALKLRYPLHTLLKHILLLFVQWGRLKMGIRAEIVTAVSHDLIYKIVEAGLRVRCSRPLTLSCRSSPSRHRWWR